MKTRRSVPLIIAAVVAMTCSSVAEAKKAPNFSCRRHVYNNSTAPWTFQASTSAGNVYFENTGCPQNGPCTLPAGSTTEIHYTTALGLTVGTMTVTDDQGNSQSFQFSSNPGVCPYIGHSGNTGAVAVNDPANGDWNAWAANWNSGARRAWPKHRAAARRH